MAEQLTLGTGQGARAGTATPAQTAHAESDAEALRHLRVLEERFLNLRHKAQLADEKLLRAEQKVAAELKQMTADIGTIRRQVMDIQEALVLVQNEMSHAASHYELKALEKYIEYTTPLVLPPRKQNLLKESSGR